jgi:hypothetical protein
MVFNSAMDALARRERIALPSELAGKSGSRLDPKSLRAERDHLVTALALRRCCRRTVITPRSASIQILFLKSIFGFGFLFKPSAITRTNTAVARAQLFGIASCDSTSHRAGPLPSHPILLGGGCFITQ